MNPSTNRVKPYTYLIGWRTRDRWYYGSRVANKVAPEDDLWGIYQTSSAYVHDEVAAFGDPDVIRVHKTFEQNEQAHEYEKKFLRRVNAKRSSRWINETIMGAPMGGTPNQLVWAKKPKSEATKEKMRLAALKRWASDDVNRKLFSEQRGQRNRDRSGSRHPNYGKTVSDETKEKISASLRARPKKVYEKKEPVPQSEINAKISEALKGRTRTAEHKANIGRSYNKSEEASANRKAAQQARRRREMEKKWTVP